VSFEACKGTLSEHLCCFWTCTILKQTEHEMRTIRLLISFNPTADRYCDDCSELEKSGKQIPATILQENHWYRDSNGTCFLHPPQCSPDQKVLRAPVVTVSGEGDRGRRQLSPPVSQQCPEARIVLQMEPKLSVSDQRGIAHSLVLYSRDKGLGANFCWKGPQCWSLDLLILAKRKQKSGLHASGGQHL
jgi:hypothetical protein